jgi:hypothetical protein
MRERFARSNASSHLIVLFVTILIAVSYFFQTLVAHVECSRMLKLKRKIAKYGELTAKV